MSEHVTAGPALQEKLAAANGHAVKLCDEAGKIIGIAVTLEQLHRYEMEVAKGRVSQEELDRRAATPGRYTMEDVFRLLEEE